MWAAPVVVPASTRGRVRRGRGRSHSRRSAGRTASYRRPDVLEVDEDDVVGRWSGRHPPCARAFAA
jgi:hypothetical protein